MLGRAPATFPVADRAAATVARAADLRRAHRRSAAARRRAASPSSIGARSMKQLVLVVGAGGQLGEAMTSAARRPARGRGARPRASSTSADADAVDATRRRRSARMSSSTARPTPTSTAPSASRWRRSRSTRWARAHAGARGDANRRDARALQHRLRLRRRDRPAVHRGGRAQSRAAPMRSRSCSANGLPPTCRALRAARREPVRRPAARAAAWTRCCQHPAPARKSARSSIAPCRRATSRTSSPRRSALLERAAPSGLYHCVNTGWTTWAGLARELARLAGPARRADRGSADGRRRSLIAPRPQVRGAVERQARRRRHRRCRPGRTRSRYVESLDQIDNRVHLKRQTAA